MPIIPVEFKSDKEIEEESKKPITIKSRGYRPFDFNNHFSCSYCSNIIWPECRMEVTDTPCVSDCPIVVQKNKILLLNSGKLEFFEIPYWYKV